MMRPIDFLDLKRFKRTMSNRWVDLRMERPKNDYLSKDVGIARCEVDVVVCRGQDSTPLHVRGRGSSGESRTKHVLAVDDDPAVRAMITDYLVDQNLRLSAAADGGEMWRVLTAGGVDLVILDLKLGDEDGLDLVRALRAKSNLPVIVFTGHFREAVDRVVGLELGTDAT
jgi:CheY-like chemotaxis protein